MIRPSDTLAIGIDPGKKGGIAVCVHKDGMVDALHLDPMPVIGNEYDTRTLASYMIEMGALAEGMGCSLLAILESPPPIPFIGKSQDRELAYGVGLIEGILCGLKYPYHKIKPKEWQKVAWRGVEKSLKPDGKVDTKATTLLSANQKLPHIQYLSSVGKKKHDGIIDALMMCYSYFYT